MRANWDQTEALILPANQNQQKLEEPQQQQHQQQEPAQQPTIGEAPADQRNPLQSATTPAWGTMADAIVVKQEPINHDDKHNDSGISPGHYMSDSASPNSRHSAACSLSPSGSASSQDSHNMPIANGYEYSPQNEYNKQCDSPPEFPANGQTPVSAALEENSMNQEASQHSNNNDVVTSNNGVDKSEPAEQLECSPDPLQCPICVFSSQSRLRFSEHLKSHCTTASKFDETEFTKSVMDQLTNGGSIGSPEDINRASPTQNERTSDHEVEEADEPGLRVPRVNSQGKVKTFRCKQCDFVAITKLDFWEHSRSHIKVEKLLTCPRCPFVTEYKHHLEYHLRNHAGSKPYKCDKCNYSCVNKSMLNSHLKSHSNVYQFRCADCAYATKYCHSLKLHLRKYKHNPAMVLNADGSPNPFPIIDVYGTRRGPKAKPKKDAEQQQQQSQQQAQQSQPQQPATFVNGLMSTVVPQQNPMQQMQFPFNPMNGLNGLPKLNGFNGFNGANPAGGLGLPATPSLMGFPYNPLFAGFPMPNPFALGAAAMPEQKEQQMELFKANLIEAARNFNGGEAKSNEQQHMDDDADAEDDVHMPDSEEQPREVQPPTSEVKVVVKQEPGEPPAPLDLSRGEIAAAFAAATSAAVAAVMQQQARSPPAAMQQQARSPPAVVQQQAMSPPAVAQQQVRSPPAPMQQQAMSPPAVVAAAPAVVVPAAPAVVAPAAVAAVAAAPTPAGQGTSRRKGRAIRLDQRVLQNDSDEEMRDVQRVVVRPPTVSPPNSNNSNGQNNAADTGKQMFKCLYCDIAFGNEIIHSMHMGYHGYQNPFTCNMCGVQSADQVSFFLHIARSAH